MKALHSTMVATTICIVALAMGAKRSEPQGQMQGSTVRGLTQLSFATGLRRFSERLRPKASRQQHHDPRRGQRWQQQAGQANFVVAG